MLNSLRKPAQLYSIEITENEYKEPIKKEKPIGLIPVSIVLNNFNQFNQNNLKLRNCAYVGITNSPDAQAGMKLNSFTIKYVLPVGAEYVLYLEEI